MYNSEDKRHKKVTLDHTNSKETYPSHCIGPERYGVTILTKQYN